jgi:hypothetical protein
MKTLLKILSIVFLSLLLNVKILPNGIKKLEQVSLPPVLDGKLDNIYSAGVSFTDFVQLEPNILAMPSVKTEIYFIYDSKNIYIAGKLFQPKSTIKSSNSRKDASIILDGDAIGIAIDPLNNGNSAYFFSINPSNAIVDGTLDASGNWDFKWDGIFSTATSIENDFWTFEFHLPLSSISFQDKDEQDWGILLKRDYAAGKEILLNQIEDKNNPYRISSFTRIEGLRDLKKENNLSITPYSFYSFKNDLKNDYRYDKVKFGGEVKYNPVSSMTLIATLNPDYAQVETDRLIINVDDVPASYPEKRPFFTESSDLYPGLAVNTRNIEDIDVGIKLRDVRDNLKYDLTWVLDSKQNKWYMGNIRWSDNEFFHIDLIGGVKNYIERTDYNFTTNLRTWFFDKRLLAYTWFGTINKPGAKNEYESVNSVRWQTRELQLMIWNQFKTEYYNPNITGHNTLSNEILVHGFAGYSFYNESGLFRVITPKFKYEFTSLYTNPGLSYSSVALGFASILHLGNAFGNWNAELYYAPVMNRKFRNRNLTDVNSIQIYEDAFSKFTLVDYKNDAVTAYLSSDNSKKVSFKLSFHNRQVRKSEAENLSGELNWKITSASVIGYSLEYVNLHGSEYQSKYNQLIHRIKAEYNITDKLNIRGIVQLNRIEMPLQNDYESSNPVLNLTLSWQYMNGSYIYLVYNKQKLNWGDKLISNSIKNDDQTFAIKVNTALSIF